MSKPTKDRYLENTRSSCKSSTGRENSGEKGAKDTHGQFSEEETSQKKKTKVI